MRGPKMTYDKRALFLDRDGVININYGHVHKKENFVLIEGIFDLCHFMESLGYLIIIITNQAGIGKGFYSEDDYEMLNNWMFSIFKKNNVTITRAYHCPHLPEDNCSCRKPKPGLIINAMNDYGINLNDSILIGDMESDILAGISAGVKFNILFEGGNHSKTISKIKELLVNTD